MSIADSSVSSDLSPVIDGGQIEAAPDPGISPGALALRRLRRNRAALAFGALFVVLVGLALAAPLYADIAGTTAAKNHLSDTIVVDGKQQQVVTFDGVPIDPTWQKKFFLGADTNGRDVAVRLLYGARNSLFIGITAALITTLPGRAARARWPATSAAGWTRSSRAASTSCGRFPCCCSASRSASRSRSAA